MNKLLNNLGRILTFVYIIYFGLLIPQLFTIIHAYNDETIIEIIRFLALLVPGIIILILALNPKASYNRRVFLIPLLIYTLGSIASYIYNIIQYRSYSGIYYIILAIILVTIYIMANSKELFYMLLCIGAIVIIPDILGILSGRTSSLIEAVLLLTILIGAYNDYLALNKDNDKDSDNEAINSDSEENE